MSEANSEDGQALRHHLSGLTKHLRLCTLTAEQICAEVATTDVLTWEEIGFVCQSIGKKRKSESFGELSNEIVPRKIAQRINTVQELTLNRQQTDSFLQSWEYNLTLTVKKNTIELLPLVCFARDRPENTCENWAYKIDCTTTINKVSPNTSDPPMTLTFSDYVQFNCSFEIPLVVGGQSITLLPDTKYEVNIKLNGAHKLYFESNTHGSYSNDHLVLHILQSPRACLGFYYTPITKLQYRTTTVGNH